MAADTWALRRTPASLTIGEAEAARAMRDRCVAYLRGTARALRGQVIGEDGPSALIARCDASALELAADQLAKMQPEPAADGLSERGA